MPHFVCADINVLPSVDVNDIDVSLLMKEISLVRYGNSNVKTLCENVVTECSTTMERLQTVVHNLADRVQSAVYSAVRKSLKGHELLMKSATEELDKISTCVNSVDGLCHISSSGKDDENEAGISVDSKSYDNVAMNTIDNSDNTETAPKTDLNMQNTELADPEFPALESKPPSPGLTPYVQTVVAPATKTAAALRPGGIPTSDSAAPGAGMPSGHGRVTAAPARGTTSHSGLRAEQPLVH